MATFQHLRPKPPRALNILRQDEPVYPAQVEAGGAYVSNKETMV